MFCSTVGFAHRNSPLAASKLQAMPVLHGTPVSVLRGPRRASGLTASMPARVGIDRRVDDHHLEGAFLIPVVARQDLMLPDDFAGLGLDREARVGAGHGGARHVALRLRGRTDAARSVEDEIELGIVGELTPDAGHPAVLERRAGPGLVAGLARARNQLVAPQLLAGLGVVAGDVAAVRRHLARAARDDHAVGDDRAAGVADVEVAAAIGLPDHACRCARRARRRYCPRSR